MSATPKRKRPHAGPAALLTTSRGGKKGASASAAPTVTSTPARELEAVEQPAYWRCVGYKPAPQLVNEHEAALLSAISAHCVVPANFDVDEAFGPLAGLSHEHRLMNAFYFGQLALKDEDAPAPIICRECGGEHVPTECVGAFARV
jgi:hypothetical protein